MRTSRAHIECLSMATNNNEGFISMLFLDLFGTIFVLKLARFTPNLRQFLALFTKQRHVLDCHKKNKDNNSNNIIIIVTIIANLCLRRFVLR